MRRPDHLLPTLGALPPFIAWLAIVIHPPLNHDVGGLLSFAGQWLDGAALYRDLVEVNPPLIMLMNVPPVLLGQVLPGGPVLALQLLLLLACALSTLLGLRVAALARQRGPLERVAVAVGLPLVCLVPGAEFGQRSHIMMVLALPYLLHAAHRAEGGPTPRRLALAVALLAGIGFALKPHYLLLPMTVETLVLRCRGTRVALADPVPWTMAGTWLGYLVLLVACFPAYLDHTLPLVRNAYSSLQWVSAATVVQSGHVLPYLAVSLAVGWAAWHGRLGALPHVLVLTVLAGTVVAVVQHKGFGYHSLPVRMASFLLVPVAVSRWLDRGLAPSLVRRARAVMAIGVAWGIGLGAMLGAEAPWAELSYAGSETDQLARLFAAEASEHEVLVLSPAVNGIYPALNYAGARNVLPTMTIWPLQSRFLGCPPPATLTPAGMDSQQRWFFETTVGNFTRRQPRLLVVAPPQRRHGCAPLDLLAYFEQHPAFVQALRAYQPIAVVHGYRVWRLRDRPRPTVPDPRPSS